MRLAVLSPHYDDAVLSCWLVLRAPESVVVMTSSREFRPRAARSGGGTVAPVPTTRPVAYESVHARIARPWRSPRALPSTSTSSSGSTETRR